MDKVKITLQYLMPKHLISRLAGKVAAAELGWFSHFLINRFIKAYKIDMSEAQLERPQDYASFNEFFTRPLKDGIRPLASEPHIVAHPVDGAISQLGPIVDGKLVQAKHHNYSLQNLLGGLEQTAAPFAGGTFATIYLAPKDYHRIHMPVSGTLREMIYIPGELFSVNPLTAECVKDLFALNERVVTIFDTEFGPMALVLVGATIVASIETVWAGTITPPTGKNIFRWTYPANGNTAIKLEKGAEMGRFKLGSTVVLAFPEGKVDFLADQQPGTVTRMGAPFAEIN
ncbi:MULTISPECIES: archaetidylserine decarboxylase [unclassified Arsukibacterium]|uniref:archaetidylserine decarboxylase n=1 Tax=unclassified Arsukibacterium TaxID=2635278 RepID=UPI000C6A7455|nr:MULTISPECIES: archaetidylserine decarboxylase [unclassified Arsukibacterium]MAA93954.1 phosphatidylserine decarboxylase [Rheinheimera sp.]MBM33643.1 phosphatidylserine decarboxylase [Rheinheimera sp.]HAW94493.1 phosphatidylserine decarboxylase [Candidatus Azambacteria bacterium]|tara:strand:- start:144724 stop:145581 length:858 start_codon:yes stop_codon:yes gene_type:complete